MNTPAVGAVVEYRYDLALVALSFIISVLGSYVALALASARGKGGDKVFGPAVALGGCAIWSMHFIGMAAYKTPLYVSYAILPAALSLVIAIVITALGFRVALKDPSKLPNLVAGGVVIGGGVVAMHYLGMLGMDLRAAIEWNWVTVGASVVIAVVAATVALWLAFNVKSTTQRATAAVVMGVAVCAMHYTGMAAATLICIAEAKRSALSVDGPFLAYLIFFIALVTLGASMLYGRLGSAGPQPA
jgi:NO-binding membrane sensor protein with MHYT domain